MGVWIVWKAWFAHMVSEWKTYIVDNVDNGFLYCYENYCKLSVSIWFGERLWNAKKLSTLSTMSTRMQNAHKLVATNQAKLVTAHMARLVSTHLQVSNH